MPRSSPPYSRPLRVRSGFQTRSVVRRGIGQGVGSASTENHLYYCRMGTAGIAAAKIAAAKGCSIIYNLGSVRSAGAGYAYYLAQAQSCITEIGTSVRHIRKVNIWPDNITVVPDYWIMNSPSTAADMQTAIGLYMQTLLNEIPALESGFNLSALDIEPEENLTGTSTSPTDWYWLRTGTMNKATLQGHVYSKSCDYRMPYAPTSVLYGGIGTNEHFPNSTPICETCYYQGGSTSDLVGSVVAGVAVSSTGNAVSGGTPYLANQFRSLYSGRTKMAFSCETSDLWVACANALP